MGLFLDPVPLICMSLLISEPPCLDHWSSGLNFEIEKCEASYFIILFKISWGIVGHLSSHMDFQFSYPVSLKKKKKRKRKKKVQCGFS